MTAPTGNRTQGLVLNVHVYPSALTTELLRHGQDCQKFRIYLMIHVNGRYLIHQNVNKDQGHFQNKDKVGYGPNRS